MHDILCQSDVLVLPLMADEGIMKTEPFKIQSYLEAGKPIYGILGGSGKDIIEENELGICVNPADIDDIALGFKNMIAFAKENSASVEVASRNLMNTRFNKDEIIGEFECGMESIISNKN
jgi:glycosyltransferase involved in cell wall biosynthesis